MIGALLLLVVAGAVVYSLLSILAAWRYLAARPPALKSIESISVLKPLAGLDPDLESHLRTFFEQDYSAFEILFAVRSGDDPAAPVVSKLQKQYPNIPTRLIVTGEPPYPNAKVYSLERMLAAAANDLVVMSDSDIQVTADLLRTVAAEFRCRGWSRRDPLLIRDRSPHRQRYAGAECGSSAALGAQHATVASHGISGPVIHDAAAAGSVSLFCQAGVVAGAGHCDCDTFFGRIYRFGARAEGTVELVAIAG